MTTNTAAFADGINTFTLWSMGELGDIRGNTRYILVQYNINRH